MGPGAPRFGPVVRTMVADHGPWRHDSVLGVSVIMDLWGMIGVCVCVCNYGLLKCDLTSVRDLEGRPGSCGTAGSRSFSA